MRDRCRLDERRRELGRVFWKKKSKSNLFLFLDWRQKYAKLSTFIRTTPKHVQEHVDSKSRNFNDNLKFLSLFHEVERLLTDFGSLNCLKINYLIIFI